MRYRRSRSVFSDSSLSLSFLRTTPAKNPLTLCCCQPVAFMIAAIVVPLAWLNIASTFACLEFERGPAVVAFLAGAGFRRALSADVLILAVLFFFDMAISSLVATASGAATTEPPRRPCGAGGVKEGKRRNDQPFEIRLIREAALSNVFDLVDELLDMKRDRYSLLSIGGIGAGLRPPGDACPLVGAPRGLRSLGVPSD